MAVVFMTDPVTGRCGLYEEAPGPRNAATFHDPNSAINRPLNDPINWLPNIFFHSDFDYLEVALAGTVSVTHAAVEAGDQISGGDTAKKSAAFSLGKGVANRLLRTHGLGYKPFALVAVGNNILWPGMPVQAPNAGNQRFATVYVTNSELRLSEWSAAKTGVPAITLAYSYIIFRRPAAASGKVLMEVFPGTNRVVLGKGKFDSLRSYLQVVASSALGFSLGRTVDLRNGAARAYRPNKTAYEPTPTDFKIALDQNIRDRSGTVVTRVVALDYGTNTMVYTGSYAAPAAVQVKAP